MNIFNIEQYPSLEGVSDHLNMSRNEVMLSWHTDPRREELMRRVRVVFNEFQDADGWQGVLSCSLTMWERSFNSTMI